MGVVAAPCIGPIVLGLLLMVQRSQSALFGFVLFFTLAVGLGLPVYRTGAGRGQYPASCRDPANGSRGSSNSSASCWSGWRSISSTR